MESLGLFSLGKTRQLRGQMIEVCKIMNGMEDSGQREGFFPSLSYFLHLGVPNEIVGNWFKTDRNEIFLSSMGVATWAV